MTSPLHSLCPPSCAVPLHLLVTIMCRILTCPALAINYHILCPEAFFHLKMERKLSVRWKECIGPEPIRTPFGPFWLAGGPGSGDHIFPKMLRNTRKRKVSCDSGGPFGTPGNPESPRAPVWRLIPGGIAKYFFILR